MGIPAWQVFADAILQHAALRFRDDRGEPPRDFAGLVVADDEIEHLIGELPGMRRASGAFDAATAAQLDDQLTEARERLRTATTAPDDLFTALAWNLGLGEPEAEVLAVIAATELDPARQSLVAYLNDNAAVRRPTLGTLWRLFPDPHPGPRVLGPDAAIRRSALVEMDDTQPWASVTVGLSSTLAWMLTGDRSLDPELPLGTRIELVEDAGDGADATDGSDATSGARLVLAAGADAEARRRAARDATAGSAFLVSPQPADRRGWDALVRQATVAGTGIIVELADHEALSPDGRRTIDRTPHLAWALTSTYELPVETLPQGDHAEVAVGAMTATVRRGSHMLDPEQDRLARLTVAGRAGDWDGAVRRLAGGHLDELAVRIRPRRTWDDLVLAPEALAQARELVVRYRRRSTVYGEWGFSAVPSSGITALFAGPSGTGKTMTAEVLAADLGLDAYRVDLAQVVSKYIGETEKNLERIFTAATTGNVVLFFDEADALFGKRSEVGDAHDRYANIEVSYLLQRLEQYDGLVVLATNLRKNMDDAFLRRIDVAIEFDLPEPDQRRAIWERAVPTTAPRADLDFDFLAERFDVSGGNISNAALAAAFLAAEEGVPIGMEHVVLGMKREFQKLGRLRTEREFDRYLDLVTGDRHAAPVG